MQLLNLVKTLEQMTEDELLEHVRKMRHNRSVIRPAARRHSERAETKATQKVSKKARNTLEAVMKQLSDAERDALIRQLEGAQE